MTSTIPTEVDWDTAPSLLDGAMELTLTPQQCNLRYWLESVPAGTLRGRPDGHDPDLKPADYMLSGPFHAAITQEYAFRALAEEKATRALSYLVPIAPDIDTMEFYTTQVMDECRHAMVFRNHLVALGVEPTDLMTSVKRLAGSYLESVLVPLEEYAHEVMRDQADFIGGVVMMTVIVEGALAPAAELSERKWRRLDPAAAQIDRGAGIDEIRHLTVGAEIGRQYLQEHPDEAPRVLKMIERGMNMWTELPVHQMILDREELFQVGLDEHKEIVGDYEIWPGRRLIDTSPAERQEAADNWSEQMKHKRLTYMGLTEALT
jgi:hypothetical protein